MSIYDLVEKQRAALLNREYAAVRRIVRAYEIAELKVEESIRGFQAKIKYAKAAGLTPSLAWYYQEARLENILREIRGHIEEFSKDALEFSDTARLDAYELGAVHALRLAEAQVIGDITGLHAGAFANAQALLIEGSPLKTIFDTIAPTAVIGAREVFAKGIAEGWGPRKLGTALKSEIEGLAKRRAVLIARTEAIRSYRLANREVYQRNADVLRGWRWTSAKTIATCALCLALDGEIFPTDEILRSHPACRCSMVPLPNTEFGGPEFLLGEDYFRSLSVRDQERILGKGKAALYREGKIGLKDNVNFKDNPDWGRAPVPHKLTVLERKYESGTLRTQLGDTSLSGFKPPPARKLEDLLGDTERKANDPVEKALSAWDRQTLYASNRRRLTLKSVNAPPYKKAVKDLKSLDSTIEEAEISDLIATLPSAPSAKVDGFIRELGDGPDLPIVFRSNGKLYLHDTDSIARVQAKSLLGQTRTSIRLFDADALVKTKTQLDLAIEELKGLGVKAVQISDTDSETALKRLAWAKARIEATGVIPEKVNVLGLRGGFVVGKNLSVGEPVGIIPTEPIKEHLLQSSVRTMTPLELVEYKSKLVRASTDYVENIEAQLYRSRFDLSKVDNPSGLLRKFGFNRYDLFSVRAFERNQLEDALEEAIIVYRRGEYRRGSLPEAIETPFLKQAETIIGKRKVIDAYSESEDILFAQVGPQAGSNPGGTYLGRDGTKRYVKFYDDPDKTYAEHLAMRLYDEFGGYGTNTAIVNRPGGGIGIASEIIEGRAVKIADHEEVLKAFAVDTFLANWDVAGASLDNILIDASGKARRIDAGGSWHYRAKVKEPKPDRVVRAFDEWTTMAFDSRGQLTPFMRAAGFDGPDEAAKFLLDQAERLDKILKGVKDWGKWVDKNAPGISDDAKRKIIEMIEARKAILKSHISDAKEAIKRAEAARKAAAKAPKRTKAKKPGANYRPEADAKNWLNEGEIKVTREGWIRELGLKEVEEIESATAKLLSDPDTLLIRNERLDTLLTHFGGLDADGGAPRFKSQHETGRSQGTLNPRLRKDAEIYLFKLIRAFGRFPTSNDQAAIYGWAQSRKLLVDGRNPADWYGEVSCVIRKSESYRITGTKGDSLGRMWVPAPIDDPNIALFGEAAYQNINNAQRFSKGGFKELHSYFEIQVHGQLRLDEIEEFIVKDTHAAKKLAPLAAKWGIKVTVV